MGFYGNITSTNKTQFSFDKIYPNRMSMDAAVAGDGVHIGRFVLVDYEDGVDVLYLEIFKGEDNVFYSDSGRTIKMTLSNCKVGNIYRLMTAQGLELYQVTGEDANKNATFEKVTNNYTKNYTCDQNNYGVGRGFDGTVWQKVYVDNVIKYVMIAELNSVVPSFRVTADAPTMSPLQPHFDAASNNVAYWLHWQPQWGLRIKGAEKDSTGSDGTVLPSDEKVEWSLPELNEQLQVINIKNKTLDGAIYYNKAGFDPQKRTVYSGDVEDAIKVEPTGKSGAKYNDHNGIGAAASTSVQPDIQEISIMLPSIGNTIANVWDLVYGYKEEDGLVRNLDVAWGSTEGVRMITERESGSGFDYDEDTYISTVAGAINSVHDLMGQFVITSAGIPENGLDKADEMIYYNLQDGKFYRKFITYDYDTKADLGAITNDEKYALIGNLINYEKNKYWVNREAENYYLSTMDNFYDFRNYYDIAKEEQTLSFKYQKQDLYYKDGYSYIQESSDSPVSGRNYKNITPTTVTTYFYEKNKFYLKESNTRYVLDNREHFDSSATYYVVTGGKEQEITIWNEAEKAWETKNVIVGGTATLATVNAISFDDATKNNTNGYYKGNKKKYTLLTQDDVTDRTKSYTVYTLKITAATKNYVPGVYYYEDTNHNFIKDMSESGDENKTYYSITPTPVDRFYKPDTYYYKDGSEYVLDASATVQNKEYYERKKLYVEEDTTGRFPTGMEWNEEVMDVYPGLSVGFRTEVIGVQELVGFGRTFNTIHGLILELRRLIDGAKEDTRDTTTLQGAVNKLNDIIAKFNEITPNKLVITDEYGRYSPATYNDTTWLGWTVNPDIDNPTVELYHKNANKSETTNIVSQGAQTPNFGATFKIPTLTFDSKGHWHTKGTETVKIPEPSLVSEPDGTADVLTKMELESATGKLTNTFTKLKDVLLTGYTKDVDKKGALMTTDSLATGLSKIENKMDSNTDLINTTASSIRGEVEEIESKIRADFAEEDTKIRSEMSTMDTNIRADFKAQDDEIQKTIQGLSGQIVDVLDELEATASDIRGELTAATTTLSASISTTDTAIRADFAAADTGLKAGYEAADTALDARLKVTEGKLEGVTTTVISSIEAEAKDRKDADDKLNTLIMNVSGTLDKTNGRIDNLINGEIGDCMKRLDGMTHPTVKESIAAVKESLSASIDTVQNEIGKVSSMAVKIAREETEPEDKNNTIWVEPTSHEIRIFDGLEWRVLVTNPMSAE